MKNIKLMFITEQPALDNIEHKKPLLGEIKKCKGINRCPYGKINGYSNPIAFKIDYYGQDIKESILPRLKNTFEYVKKILDEKITIYWTHYVKCFGNFKLTEEKKLTKKNGLTKDALNQCGNKWIRREINKFRPDIIATLGTYASGYLIYGKGEIIFNRIQICEYNESEMFSRRIFVLPHPSKGSPTSNDYWNGDIPTRKLKNCLKKMISE